MFKMKNKDDENGITLVALVVTIIVLLILTGITVSTTVGDNGLLTVTKNIKENIAKAEDEGQAQVDAVKNSQYLEDGTVIVNDKNAPTINSMDVTRLSDTSFKISVNVTELESGIAKIEYSIDGGKSFVSSSDSKEISYTFKELTAGFEEYNIVVKATDSSGNSSTASKRFQMVTESLIPNGFYYVGGTKYSGIVISSSANDKEKYKGKDVVGTDLDGNYQYVWIPCTTDTTSSELQYARTEWGVEDDFNTRAIKDELTLEDSSITYSDIDLQYGVTPEVTKQIVAQVKSEKESVSKYGGYYIARYEVGNINDTTVIKYNQKPYADIVWSEAYELANNIITKSNANSYLCSSYAWDTAVNFIQNNSEAKNYATSIEGVNGNWNPQEVKDKNGQVIKPAGTSQQLNTGLTTQFCNIFDMGGNEGEFTTEIEPGTSESIIVRSGEYPFMFPAGIRWDASAALSLDSYGFRSTLFLK